MHRRLREFGQRYSLTEEKATLYGVFNDYQVSFQYDAFTNPQQTAYVAADTRAAYQQINAFLSTNQKRLHIVRFLCYAEGIAFSVLGMTGKKEVEYLESATRELTDFLKTQGVPTAEYCVYCGQRMEEKVLVNQDGSKFYAHEACFVQAHGSIVQAEQAYDAQPNHYGRGILGAFIGALIGCVVWAIVYLIGFVASIVAFLTAFLAGKFYDLLGGKANKVKIVVVSLVSLGGIALTMFGIYLAVAAGLAVMDGLSLSAFEAFSKYMAEFPDFKSEFLTNLLMSLLFGVLGVASTVWDMARAQRKVSKSMKIEK